MIGTGFMGNAHSQAWRVAPRFFDLPLSPVMQVIVGRNGARTQEAADRLGWAESATDWQAVIERDDIDLIDICSPGDSHAEIAIAALEAGKHVLCEKPLANTPAEAEEMVTAARRASERGIRSMVGFTYRRVPAITFARQLVHAGRIGTLRQARAAYLQDWLVDENGPMTWRLDKSRAGSGALGDIGAHAVDAVQFITGQRVDDVSGHLRTFVTERPLLAETVGLSGTASSERGTVTVDDAAWFTGRLSGGAVASFEASRYALGRKNGLTIELYGSRGAIMFDLERLNELQFYDAADSATEQGFRRILVTEPEHPYAGAWWPTGHPLGYEHGFSHQVVDLVKDIAEGRDPSPSFDDGLQVQRVLDAVERSSGSDGAWAAVG
ncbi:Gfo/Idh/MocA family protein [Curtobacterium ammoniigenes]|uniref:Gfo/Idh/MocA family protein n=1 Tax=Curtobacterium ammoniigenes TaxID=395387 RepID=UPI000835DC95|nr:Gfo/Idh/MocA family oxidoreductase [Curtobacterium ammoniigenes]